MPLNLEIDYAVRTETGEKPENADAASVSKPEGNTLLSKGIAAAIADGVSSSEGGKEASQICVSCFFNDYYSTPDSWTVKTSVGKVLGALNRWLYSQGQMRYGSARGMVSTFSGLVVKSTTAHIFHVGDSRIYQIRGEQFEQVTRDHRVWVAKDRDFLSRAMGIDPNIEIDYRTLAVEPGDMFLFVTDGVSGHVTDNRLRQLIKEHSDPIAIPISSAVDTSPYLHVNLQAASNAIIEEALHNGSHDNVTCLLLRVISLPSKTEDDILQKITELPFPPFLGPGMKIDGYEILREMHISRRNEVFLALDQVTDERVILKTPSVNYRDDPAYLDGFLHEEWIGRRIDNSHVMKILDTPRRRFLYNISEYIDGHSLRQWMNDHPQTPINKTREFIRQIAEGLRAFHRLEMIHLDLKPENILIDNWDTLKIIDFGSTRVAGTSEIASSFSKDVTEGTINYTAPECQKGYCSNHSDIFSLGVIAYELLTGALPYGENESLRPSSHLTYVPASKYNENIQPWIDGALRKATHTNPSKRYDSLSEFLYDLSHPNSKFLQRDFQPLIERDPVGFWRYLALSLLILNLVLWYLLVRS